MRIKKNKTQKELTSQLQRMEGELDALSTEVKNKQKEFNQKKQSVEGLKKKISDLKTTGEPTISEHAFVRYFERVENINMDYIASLILTDEMLELIKKMGGNGKYKNSNGFTLVMKENTVVTIEI